MTTPQPNPNIDPELYRLMDDAGLAAGTLANAKKSMPLLINEIRTALAEKLRSYVARREADAFNNGFKKGANNGQKDI